MKEKLVFGFDLGKASIGICVRVGHEIKQLKSMLINPEYADVSENRKRRRAKLTRDAHKSREKYLKTIWEKANLSPLENNDT
ncbi:MAG: hypothetical protein WCG23_03200, partial [bacterium]